MSLDVYFEVFVASRPDVLKRSARLSRGWMMVVWVDDGRLLRPSNLRGTYPSHIV